jgi:hypothetical protein
MAEITGVEQHLADKGRCIREIKRILDDLQITALAEFGEREAALGTDFQMKYTSFLIGTLDAAIEHYYNGFIRTGYRN